MSARSRRPGRTGEDAANRCGRDDREINEALYGNAPPGGEHLVIGHESFGQVVEIGNKVTSSKSATTSRAPFADRVVRIHTIGRNDITSEEVYYERGINLATAT